MYSSTEAASSPTALGLIPGLPHLIHSQPDDDRVNPCSPMGQHIKMESEHNNNQSEANSRTLYNLDQMVRCWAKAILTMIWSFRYFFTPSSYKLLLYLGFASQMALLGLYHNSSLFKSPVTSIHAGMRDARHCVRERECMWQCIY